jgi:MFS family permease
MSASHGTAASPFKQPRAVWAVAFACVISFMGIGLVDPILPALATNLHATPSQVSLLFTSYLVVTAVAMLVVGWVSSRFGAKLTLVIGLTIIVVFAALAGNANSINGIVGFRAGWGLGNALFIATSLAVIVASASGGFAGAIILYETALGLGIAVGPLLGGELGGISWRDPFFGVAVLMAVALVATVAFVPRLPKPEHRTSLAAPIKALRHRGLLTMGLMALLYNWGFFTMLGYAPYPMKLSAHGLGLVFTGWGLLVAVFSVFVAPRLQARFGTAPVLYANLLGLGVVMTVIGAGVNTPTAVIVAVIVSGACIGINNTLTTQAVMLVSPVERSVASSAYGFVRFIGGGLAPFAAGKIADATDLSVPFYVGALAFILAIGVLATGHRLISAAEKGTVDSETVRPTLQRVVATPASGYRPVIVAVGAAEDAAEIVDAAAVIARDARALLEVVHVRETAVVEELATDTEDASQGRAAVLAHLDRLAEQGIAATGQVLTSVGDHATAGRILAKHAADVQARAIAVGRSSHGTVEQFADGSFIAALTHAATCTVVLVEPGKRPYRLTVASLDELHRRSVHESLGSEMAGVRGQDGTALSTLTVPDIRPVRDSGAKGFDGPNGFHGRHVRGAETGLRVITGVVRDREGGPLRGASITVTDTSGRQQGLTSVSADGRYTVGGLTPGSYIVIAAAPDLRPSAASVLAGAGDVTTDFILDGKPAVHSGEVHGIIRSPHGAPVGGITATLTNDTGEVVASTVSDGTGAYRITGLADGQYTLVASGHRPATVEVIVGVGEPATVEVALGDEAR